VTVRERADDNSVLLVVQDFGIGIPLSQQPAIFGRFVRADNVRSYGIGGTGLGLYLCRELIEQQGGRVWFESVEGRGSTFFISLPIISDEDFFEASSDDSSSPVTPS
jgi:two-component system sensor histidine kinase VicK